MHEVSFAEQVITNAGVTGSNIVSAPKTSLVRSFKKDVDDEGSAKCKSRPTYRYMARAARV